MITTKPKRDEAPSPNAEEGPGSVLIFSIIVDLKRRSGLGLGV